MELSMGIEAQSTWLAIRITEFPWNNPWNSQMAIEAHGAWLAKRHIVFPWRATWNCQWQFRWMAHDWLKGIFYFHAVFHRNVNGNRGTGREWHG
jgi:hypothetical protein